MTENANEALMLRAIEESDKDKGHDNHWSGLDNKKSSRTTIDILRDRNQSIKDQNIQSLRDDGIRFKEHYVNLGKMIARPTDNYKAEHGAGSTKNLLNTAIEFNDNIYFPTARFWTSLCAKVGVSPSVFNLFDHSEVFDRCVALDKVSATGRIRVVEDVKHKTLLAISDPAKEIIHWDNAMNLLAAKDARGVSYDGSGVITSTHALPNEVPFMIGGEKFGQRITVRTPIDGYGSPSIYLALLRAVCANGLVAMCKAFKTVVKTGKKARGGKHDPIEFALERMFDSFSNDEGFDALARRIEAARSAKMSVREFHNAQKILCSLKNNDPNAVGIDKLIRPEVRLFSRHAGDLHSKYGLAHLQEMTDRQMGLLPTDMSLYEAFNFLTEVATHKLNLKDKVEASTATRIQGWIGQKLTRSFDLEGTVDAEDIPDSYRDLYFGAGVNAN